jgi:hypothetical protein
VNVGTVSTSIKNGEGLVNVVGHMLEELRNLATKFFPSLKKRKSRTNLAKYCYSNFPNAAKALLVFNSPERLAEFGQIGHAWLRNHFQGKILVYIN